MDRIQIDGWTDRGWRDRRTDGKTTLKTYIPLEVSRGTNNMRTNLSSSTNSKANKTNVISGHLKYTMMPLHVPRVSGDQQTTTIDRWRRIVMPFIYKCPCTNRVDYSSRRFNSVSLIFFKVPENL